MDEESKCSIRSEESIPNPIYEEVITANAENTKESSSPNKQSNSSTPQNDETTTTTIEAESDEESDDDSSSSSSESSAISCSSSCSVTDMNEGYSNKQMKNIDKDVDKIHHNDDEDNSCPPSSTTDTFSSTEHLKKSPTVITPKSVSIKNVAKITTSPDDSTKSPPNIKLLLKKPTAATASATKSGGAPVIKVKAPTKPVFFVTVLSNTPAGPTYSTATYSPAGVSQAQFLQQVTNSNANKVSKCSEIEENSSTSLMSAEEPIETSKITTPVTTTTITAVVPDPISVEESIPDTNTDDKELDKNSQLECREEADDYESVKSDQDHEMKTSTPKIGRELMQLQKTVSESKVLSEFINDSAVTKSRKSRKTPFKHGSDTEYSPMSSQLSSSRRRSRSRSSSKTRVDSPYQDSGGSPLLGKWPSEERINKRMNMRSQNTEFVQKHMKFLNRINNADADTDNSDGELQSNETKSIPSVDSQLDILKRNYLPSPKRGWDAFCWKCATCGDLIPCSKCVRSYHLKCLKSQALSKLDKDWACPECVATEHFIKGMSRSGKNSLSVDHLNQLMQFAVKRMKHFKEHEKFLGNFDENEYPEYHKYIVNPVTLESIQKKIDNRSYKCSEELVTEVKWIQHNATVYFGSNNKVTTLAKQFVKVCRQEVNEIETCPECYYNANTKKDWFIEVCSKPHVLLWAKLKGFPYWPAKSMGVSSSLVNVRFFGAHDRAHVPLKDCYLYSESDPNPTTKANKRNLIAGSIKEVDAHIRKIVTKFGTFKYAPFKTLYDPSRESMQLEMMIPGVTEYIKNVHLSSKPALTFKIVKTADNNLSMIKKTDVNGELRANDINKSDNNMNSSSGVSSFVKISKINSPSNNASITDSSSRSIDNNAIISTKFIYKSNSIPASNESSSSEGDQNSLQLSSSSMKTPSTNRKSSDDLVKSYEVIAKKDENDISNNKVSTVILKRKSDNWNAITTTTTATLKRSKISDTEDAEIEKVDVVEMEKSISEKKDAETKGCEKRKLSIDNDSENSMNTQQTQKPRLGNESDQIQSGADVTTRRVSTQLKQNQNQNQKSSSSNAHSEEILTIRIGNAKMISKSVLSAINEDRKLLSQSEGQINKSKEKQSKDISTDKIQKKKEETASAGDKIIIKVENEESNAKEQSKSHITQDNQAESPTVERMKSRDCQSSAVVKDQNQKHEKIAKPKQIKTSDNNSKFPKIDKILISKKSQENREVSGKNNESRKNQNQTNSPVVNSSSIDKSSSLTEKATQVLNESKSCETNSNAKPSSEKILVKVQDISHLLTEIKTEKPDNSDDEYQTGSVKNKPEFIDVQDKSKTTTTTVQQSKKTNETQSTKETNSDNVVNSITDSSIVTIKTEICSDDDDDGDPLRTSLMKQSNLSLMDKANMSNLEKSNPQRISVRDFATMRILPTKKAEKRAIPSGVVKVDMKRRNQRARKSFPNKGNTPSSLLPSPSVITSKSSTLQPFSTYPKQNLNSMVYIPMDTKNTAPLQKSVPIPPLTAVSKVSSQQQQQPQKHMGTLITSSSATTINGNSSSSASISISNITITKSPTNGTQVTTGTPTPITSHTAAMPNHHLNNQSHNTDNESTSSRSDRHMLSGFVTPSLASAITETIVRGPPKLAPKPTGPLRSEGDFIFQTEAGPVSKTLMENAHKMTDFFRSVIEDTLGDMANNGVLEAKLQLLEIEMEKLKHSHNKEITELKHNTDLMLCEMRNSLENEKQRLIAETRKQCEIERIRAVEEAKKKQWCANCGKEAQFYCCWNTSYCDYPCQQKHWSRHMSSCAQNDNPDASAQKVGVKIQSSNMKDKSNKLKEIPMPRLPPNTFLRPASIAAQAQRNAVPVHRLVSIPVPITTAAPRFTLLNREGNWELMSTSPQSNFQHRLQLTTPNNQIIQDVVNNVSGNGLKVATSSISTLSSNSRMIDTAAICSNKL